MSREVAIRGEYVLIRQKLSALQITQGDKAPDGAVPKIDIIEIVRDIVCIEVAGVIFLEDIGERT